MKEHLYPKIIVITYNFISLKSIIYVVINPTCPRYILDILHGHPSGTHIWLLPKATNLWFRRVCHAGVLARVQRFSGVFRLVIITCHMITAEDSQGNNERQAAGGGQKIFKLNQLISDRTRR